jgi:hypothetical protein
LNTIEIAGFPIDEEVVLKKRGYHFDIGFEISNHGRLVDARFGQCGRGTWCYYVLIAEPMLTPEAFAEFWLPHTEFVRASGFADPVYAYHAARFADAQWHGGVTFYEKLGGIDGAQRFVKIGCDFAHYWDQGHWFTYAQVEREAKETIEALRRMYAFNRRCIYSGRWLPEDQMIEREGRLYSPEGLATKAKYDAERESERSE